jgi:hypothetical protein
MRDVSPTPGVRSPRSQLDPCARLDPFFAGALPPDARPAFHRHLDRCADCRDRLWRALMRDALDTFDDDPGIAAVLAGLLNLERTSAKPNESENRQGRPAR